jgi:hypothetical protein
MNFRLPFAEHVATLSSSIDTALPPGYSRASMMSIERRYIVAMVRTRQAQLVRKIVGYSFLADVLASGFIYLAFSHIIGFILFILGLIMTGFAYLNIRTVLRVRGVR